MELAQVYTVGTQLETFDRFQGPPFITDTQVHVVGERRGDAVEVRARYTTDASKEREDDGEGEPIPLWTISAECIATFHITGDPEEVEFTDDQLEGFALLVGAPAIHPYARELTQDLSGRTLYPAFTLGLLHSFAELDDQTEIELSDPQGGGATANSVNAD
ncbi:hypothetical protein [Nocardioides furvisabuli]|uniref:hypothetical protein n=1 Tax=Nocardioides furvisabuli TaxID=375542 RepID=UPI001E5445A3|nr:hypothetical protein [Nocardioides furvisabuli]